MPFYDSPPSWLLGLVVTVVMALIVFGSSAYSWLVTPPSPRKKAESVITPRKAVRYKGRSAGSKSLNGLNPRSALPDARSATSERSNVQPERSAVQPEPADTDLPVNAEELVQLARAITLRAQGSTEQAAIEQAFGCSKGGSKAWARGKRLFAAAAGGSK
jgi:hypothetical protein